MNQIERTGPIKVSEKGAKWLSAQIKFAMSLKYPPRLDKKASKFYREIARSESIGEIDLIDPYGKDYDESKIVK